jgi:hypothetical protein
MNMLTRPNTQMPAGILDTALRTDLVIAVSSLQPIGNVKDTARLYGLLVVHLPENHVEIHANHVP